MAKTFLGYGHLFGRSAKASDENDDEKEKSKKAKGRRAEDDDEKDRDDEGDDDKGKSKKSKSRRAEDDDDDRDDDEDDKEKSKKARSRRADDDDDADADGGDEEDGDEDDGDDDDEDRDVKKGRRAERNRISRILGSKYAAGNGPLAVSLALNSGMSSAAAVRVMAGSGQASFSSQSRRKSLDERMSSVENHKLGNDAPPPAAGSSSAAVAKMASLYNSVKGKK